MHGAGHKARVTLRPSTATHRLSNWLNRDCNILLPWADMFHIGLTEVLCTAVYCKYLGTQRVRYVEDCRRLWLKSVEEC
jgi:hypothetical protein